MSEIPADIIKAARASWPSARDEASAIHMTIARAILAERQRAKELLEAASGILDGSIQMQITVDASEKLDRLSMAIHSYKSQS